MTHAEDGQSTTPAPGTYTIDVGRSTIAFTTRHFFGLGAVRGTFAFASGQVYVAAETTQSSATAVIDVDSFSTASGTRDKVVRSPKYLNSPAHPHITFASKAVHVTGTGYVLHGDLTVKATAQPVELAVDEGQFRARARRGEPGIRLATQNVHDLGERTLRQPPDDPLVRPTRTGLGPTRHRRAAPLVEGLTTFQPQVTRYLLNHGHRRR